MNRHSIHNFFDAVVREQASDLHLLESHAPKIRLHGKIRPLRKEPLTSQEMENFLKPLISEQTWKRFLQTGDLDFAYEMSEDVRFRCNYYKHIEGLGAVFRLIPKQILSLKELGLPPIVQSFGDYKSGLILITGPTGSGKSTTLASLIDYINRTHSKHIVTLEEPVEFVHANQRSIVTQREIPHDVPSFALGLRAALREDADVVLVGEMRDLETISLALTAAEMGLLVFGTLHTNHANKTIDRIMDVFPAERQPQIRTMLAHSLKAVCSQLLLQKKDGSGRFPVNEILLSNSAVSSIIREGNTARLYDVIKTGRSKGMQLMDDAISHSLVEEKIGVREAYMKSLEKKRFKPYLTTRMLRLEEAARSCRAQHDLKEDQIPLFVDDLLDPTVDDSYKTEFLMALAQKGETSAEISAFVRSILPKSLKIPGVNGSWEGKPILDCCGTGGGGLNIMNISTGLMFILAAAGIPVVKHGNRGMTKISGSADVLHALEIRYDLPPRLVQRSMERLGMAFVFAPLYHPAFKTIAKVRKDLAAIGQRTIFNLLGPLLNPVRPQAQILGVFRKEYLSLFDNALTSLACPRHMIIYGTNAHANPIGEVSVDGITQLQGILDGNIFTETLEGNDQHGKFEELIVQSAAESASKILSVLEGKNRGMARSILITNASIALLTQGEVSSLQEGSDIAAEAIDSGRALRKLQNAQLFSAEIKDTLQE